MDWAMRELKLLVYDNTDVKMSGYDSDNEDGMLAMAHKMSCGVDDVAEFPKVSSFSKVHNHHSQACRVCSSYPEFPHAWKLRKFRLIKPILDHSEDDGHALDLCQHHVAVSYCWPP